jgi:hypothetical protein
MRAPFVEADVDRKLGEVNATLPPGSRPESTSVIARVISKPGSYSLTISVDAIQPGMTEPERIAQEVPVVLK